MPNQITSSGIEVKTYSEIVAALTLAWQQIFGSDVNTDQNSPDGQLINNIALQVMDQGNFIVQDYDSKDPDQALGIALDAISQYCGIARRGGTYTQTNVDVTVDRSVTLNGMDTDSPFTVSDGSGTLFQLITTASISAGSNTLLFQAVDIGAVQVTPNTLTTPVTVILGVTSVNNPDSPTATGEDEETDSEFRLRRQASTGIPSQGNLYGLRGAILSLDGVTAVAIHENTDSSADADGVPARGIWVIVKGGVAADIGEMIYKYRPLGCPMKGSETVTITQVDSTTIDMLYDAAAAQDLYIELTVASKSGSSIDASALKAAIVAAWSLGINETADVTALASIVHAYSDDLVVTASGVSDSGSGYTTSVDPSAKNKYFVPSTANISVTT